MNTIQDAVKAKCLLISGVEDAFLGEPEAGSIPHTYTTYMWIRGRFLRSEHLTFGGTIRMVYEFILHLVFGGSDEDPQTVQADGGVFPDRVRAAFTIDPTIGGTAWDSALSDGGDNFDTYAISEEVPQQLYRLLVEEHVESSAAAGS